MGRSNFAERLESYARINYKSEEKMAEALGIPPEQFSDYLSGKTEPDFFIIKQLAVLGCDMNWLLRDKKSIFLN